MLEFDLRVTRDGVVILHHDPFVTDPDGRRHVIAECSYKELLAHKADLATFEQALEAVETSVDLYIEVKAGEDTKPIVSTIITYLSRGWQAKNFHIGSFSQKTLLEMHAALPDIDKIVIEKWSGLRATWRARQLGTDQICMNQRWLWRGFIRHLSLRGWKLYAYTLNDVAKARRWGKSGLAGVVTDYPDRFEKS